MRAVRAQVTAVDISFRAHVEKRNPSGRSLGIELRDPPQVRLTVMYEGAPPDLVPGLTAIVVLED